MISTRGRYALRVMIDLSQQRADGYVPLKEIAQRQQISEKYLESIVKELVRGGCLEGMRGKGGGYRLVRAPGDYTLGEILRLMEGSLAPVSCLEDGDQSCARRADCPMLPVWRELNDVINRFFDARTLDDLMRTEPANTV